MKKKKRVLDVLFGYAGRHKWFTVGSWLLSALSALMALVPFVYIWLILRDVLAGQYGRITGYGWHAVGWTLASMAVYLVALMFSHLAAFRIAANMRRTLLRHLMTLPVGQLQCFGSGRLRKTVMEASAATESYLAHRLPDAAGSYATPVGLLLLLLWFDWRMGLLTVATSLLAFVILFAFMIGPKLKQAMNEYQGALERMSNEAVEYVRGIPVVKTFGQSVYSFRRFKQAIDDYGRWVISYTRSMRWPMVAYTTVINGVFAVLIAFALVRKVELADLLYYVIVSPALTLMLYRVMMQSEDKMVVEDAIMRTDELLSMRPLTESRNPQVPRDNSVELRGVTFRYDGNAEDALHEVSLSVKAGEQVAFVGPSGGGKTTLVSLVARFWDVKEGEVRIGGVNVEDIAKERLADTVSFVFQDSRLLKTSILENVRLGRPDATRDDVLHALHEAQCDDILQKLPDGIDTQIGTRGTYLSGGEQQRLSIARVILQDAPILILDEATAFADPDNEQRVMEAFRRMSRGKTVLKIAHRLPTVTDADCIYVMKDGRIAEQGTHEELLDRHGLYNNMWEEWNHNVEH